MGTGPVVFLGLSTFSGVIWSSEQPCHPGKLGQVLVFPFCRRETLIFVGSMSLGPKVTEPGTMRQSRHQSWGSGGAGLGSLASALRQCIGEPAPFSGFKS